MAVEDATDVHQHLWPEELVDRLRARASPPYLRGWTLYVDGRPPRPVDPAAHDVTARIEQDERDGVGCAWLTLDPSLAAVDDLRDAWHDGVSRPSPHHRAWASVAAADPDLGQLATRLADGFVGVQLTAAALRSPAGWERVADVLAVAEAAGRPVLVHPGPAATPARTPAGTPDQPLPGWWDAVVDDAAQLQAAWWGWHAAGGREQLPTLRILFAAGAGLAPVLHERRTAAGGERTTIDADVFVDTATCGPQALDALVRVLGIDVLVAGSDRPHAEPLGGQALDRALGDAATRAVRVVNPARLLDRARVRTPGTARDAHHHHHQGEERTWPRAS